MAPATTLAMLPSVAQLININLAQSSPGTTCIPCVPESCGTVVTLGHGFITTGLLWGSAFGYAIDHQLLRASATFLVTAVLASVGVIHSIDPNGAVYWPWEAPCDDVYQWLSAYLALALLMLILHFVAPAHVVSRPHSESIEGSYHHLERHEGRLTAPFEESVSNGPSNRLPKKNSTAIYDEGEEDY